MKQGTKPKVGDWIRWSHYGIWIGQIKYKAGNMWLVHWKCCYMQRERTWRTWERRKWGLHCASRVQRARRITRAEALGEFTLAHLSR